MLDAVDDAWRDCNLDGVKRNDRLRTKYPYIFSTPVDGMIPEFLCEPTMPLYGMEYLTWNPKTPMWLKEVAELDTREPWHNYWLDYPEKNPYNTTFIRATLIVRSSFLLVIPWLLSVVSLSAIQLSPTQKLSAVGSRLSKVRLRLWSR
ncbi:hypothetical protein PHMEG_00014597 [Phytophthora megakarya]|uniref:Uncharacterized protein n=1 Tax=Phytophthora megakarya TaxID=4795 RepID=A0A225W3E1_9STRA|nr:hypothetical protein PHMEG_00014597 [Phytophthora megakarya]